MTPHAYQGQDADKRGLLDRFLVANGVAEWLQGGTCAPRSSATPTGS